MPGKPRSLTADNIGAALYEINKAAKRRRDAASAARARGAYGLMGSHLCEKELLYSLKTDVLSKAHRDGLAQFVGYHVKRDHRRETMMACYELGGFRFHLVLEYESEMPSDAQTLIDDLGEWISTATPRTRLMTIQDAKATLQAYQMSD